MNVKVYHSFFLKLFTCRIAKMLYKNILSTQSDICISTNHFKWWIINSELGLHVVYFATLQIFIYEPAI